MSSLLWIISTAVALHVLLFYVNGQTPTCQVDVAILVDSSGSIFDNGGEAAWYNMTNFTSSIIKNLTGSNNQQNLESHVSIIKFGHISTVITPLVQDDAILQAGIDTLKVIQKGQTTNTSAALYDALQIFSNTEFNRTFGNRPPVPNVVILITDGKPTRGLNGKTDSTPEGKTAIINEVLSLADQLKGLQQGGARTTVITIGVTDQIDPELLQNVSSDPLKYYFRVMDFSVLMVELETVIQSTCQAAAPPNCTNNVDVFFGIDSSGSIGEQNFKEIRKFVAGLIKQIPIGNGARAGVMYYSQGVNMGFNLNTYDKIDEAANATMRISYLRSSTNTAGMLRDLRVNGFNANAGDRATVPNVAVIFTDGNSNVQSEETLAEAYLAKQAGIHIIVIGITNWNNIYELEGLASDPYSANYIHVGNATLLNIGDTYARRLKALLCNDVNECFGVNCQCGGTCLDKIGSFMCRCPGSCSGVFCEKTCSERSDVVFAVDSSGSMQASDFRTSLNFVHNVIMGLNIQSGDRVGFVRFSSSPMTLFNLNTFTSTDALLNGLTVYFNGGSTLTQTAIQNIRNNMFTVANGAVASNTKVLVIITDGRSTKFNETWIQARLARQAGINVIVVGVGSNKYVKELQAMASGEDNTNVFDINSFTDLSASVNAVTNAVCNNIGECENTICQNGGTPVDHIGYCTCNCPVQSQGQAAYSGRFCERFGPGQVDIVLVIDVSGSIRRDRLMEVLKFITDFVKNYPVGDNGARFAAIFFSDTATISFNLNTYTLQQDIITAIMEIPFLGDTTNIADAIALATNNIFTAANGDRASAPNYMVIFTDGKSTVNQNTVISNATNFRENVGKIVVFGIGSDAYTLELIGMASQPISNMLMWAPSFNNLLANTSYRADMLNSLTLSLSDGINQCDANPCSSAQGVVCNDDLHTYVCTCPLTLAGINCGRTCPVQMDLALVLDFSGSVDRDYNTTIAFAREIIYGLSAPTNVHIALVEYDTKARVHFLLNRYTTSKLQLLNAISFTEYGTTTNTQAALGLVNDQVFTTAGGDRPGIRNVALVVTDGNSNVNKPNTIPQANALRSANVELFVAAINPSNQAEIDGIANTPSSTHVVQIPTNTVAAARQAASTMLDLLCNLA